MEKKCLDESGQTCGGRGNCQCGLCECNEGFLGPKCLQKSQDCPNTNGSKYIRYPFQQFSNFLELSVYMFMGLGP